MPFHSFEGKRIFYRETGNSAGSPLLLLHGNTASSRMFQGVLDLYMEKYRVILMDFLGHGDSDRLDRFPVDLWYEEARQAAGFLRTLNAGRVNVIGTSGGALAALNLALEWPELVLAVVADSFEGARSVDAFAGAIRQEREDSRANPAAVAFYRANHGEDWESVVENDTMAIEVHHREIGRFFHRDLSELAVPVLITASREDEYLSLLDLESLYASLESAIPDCRRHLFEEGGHPAMLSNPRGFARLAGEFFASHGGQVPSLSGQKERYHE